jgi:hypothetical protein
MADGLMGNPYIGLLSAGLSPEQAQAAVDEQRAMQFANMNPQAQISAGIYKGISGIGRALGVKDPMLEQASKLREMASQFDTTTAEGMMQYAQALQKMGNIPAAQQAALQARQMMVQEAKIAQTEAETAETKRKGTAASAAASSRAKALMQRFPNMSEEEAKGFAEDPLVVKDLLRVPKEAAVKTQVVKANGKQVLINSETGAIITEIGTAEPSLQEALGTGLAQVAGFVAKKQGEAAGTAGGKVVGEATGMIQGKEDALSAVKSARDLLSSGIYTGGYGPMQEAVAKFTPIGSKERLANTEQYRALIGEVVIPRLQEFGGNDSVEELRYLRQVVGGEVVLEKKALERILQQAETKIQRGIKRIQEQQEAIQQGKPLPTGVSGAKVINWNDLPSKGK